MQFGQWAVYAQTLLDRAGFDNEAWTIHNFLDYSDKLRDIIRELPASEQDTPELRSFALRLRELRDDFESIVAADPMCVYKPKHAVAYDFHRSQARYRYYWGSNRSAKTQSGSAEVYWTVTGQHPFRPATPPGSRAYIIGVNFKQYRPNVFEPKYIYGEQGNPLSPMFPEGGKWFYNYDKVSHILTTCCPACAATGRGGSCPGHHPKGSVALFSDEGGARVVQGGQAAIIQLDEQIREEIFNECTERIKTVPNAGIIVTETPLKGKQFWTWKTLHTLAQSGEVVPGTDVPICEEFHIDQFQAGLIPHQEIIASLATKSESEIRSRIFGEPMVSIEKAIFDPHVLEKIRKEEIEEPTVGQIAIVVKNEEKNTESYHIHRPDLAQDVLLAEANEGTEARFVHDEAGMVEMWRKPKKFQQYIIGADVAHGLTHRDSSCADVISMNPVGTSVALEQCAQMHGWINALLYAEELFKLGLLYSTPGEFYPYLVIERNGPGMEVIQRLTDLGCWFVFQDVTSGAQVKYQLQSQYGVTTSLASKPVLISILQGVLRNKKFGQPSITIHSERTLDQLETFIQEDTEKGNPRFLGEGGGHDDCVMSLAVGTYGVKNFPLFDYELHAEWIARRKIGKKTDSYSQLVWDRLHAEQKDRLEAQRELDQWEEY